MLVPLCLDPPSGLTWIAEASRSTANVHSARLVTTAGTAVDRFELTDRNERKLDEEAKGAVVRAVRDGVTPKRRLLSRRR